MFVEVFYIVIGLVLGIPVSLFVSVWLQPALLRVIEKRSQTSKVQNEKARAVEVAMIARMRADPALATALLFHDGIQGLSQALVGVGLIVAGFILVGPPPELGGSDAVTVMTSVTRMFGALFPVFGAFLLYAASVPLFRMFARAQGIEKLSRLRNSD